MNHTNDPSNSNSNAMMRHFFYPSVPLLPVPAHSMPAGYDVQPYDVINGRGKKSAQNVGNRRFNTTIAIFRSKYAEAVNRKEKSLIIQTIIRCVRESGGHFLKRDHERWVEIGDDAAYEKVSHALRDMTLSLKVNPKAPRTTQIKQQLPIVAPPPPHTNASPSSSHTDNGILKKQRATTAKLRPVSPSESSSQSQPPPKVRQSKPKRKAVVAVVAADAPSSVSSTDSMKDSESAKNVALHPSSTSSNILHQETTMKRLQLDAAELLLSLSKSDMVLVRP